MFSFEDMRSEILRINALAPQQYTFNNSESITIAKAQLACAILAIDKTKLDQLPDVETKQKLIRKQFTKIALFTSPDKHQTDGLLDEATLARGTVDAAFHLLFHFVAGKAANYTDLESFFQDMFAGFDWDAMWEESAREENEKHKQTWQTDLSRSAQQMQSIINEIADIRSYILNVLDSSKTTVDLLQSHTEGLFCNIKHNTTDCNQSFIPIRNLQRNLEMFFDRSFIEPPNDNSSKTPEQFVLRLASGQKLEYSEIYTAKAAETRTLLFEAQFLAICIAICEKISCKFLELIKAPVRSPVDIIPPSTFIEFVQEFTGQESPITLDDSAASLLPLLNKFVSERPSMIGELILQAKAMRYNSYKNERSEIAIQRFFNEFASYFTQPAGILITSIIESREPGKISFSSKLAQVISCVDSSLIVLSQDLKPLHFPSALIEKPLSSNKELEVTVFKAKLSNVLKNYTDYSLQNCRFSIFHRHGETGRLRAKEFINELFKLSNIDEMRGSLIKYLQDKRNGNTHSHSFRTMLLEAFVGHFPTKDFQSQLANLGEWKQPNPVVMLGG